MDAEASPAVVSLSYGLAASGSVDIAEVTVTAEHGKRQKYRLDANGKLTARIKLDGTRAVETLYTRDLLGRVTGVRDPLGNKWSYEYDLLGNRTSVNDPDLGNWLYTFDDASRLIRQEDAKGQATILAYDTLGRVVRKTVRPANPGSRPDEITSFTYDEVRFNTLEIPYFNKGKLTTARRTVATQTLGGVVLDAVSVTREYDHDLAGRLVHEKHRILKDGTTFIEKHTSTDYWPDGQVKSRKLADGFETGDYLYDAAGRLVSIDNDNTVTNPGNAVGDMVPATFIQSVAYNARGQTTAISYGDGTSTAFEYDPARGWLARVIATRSGAVLLDQVYERNEKGMITQITRPDGVNIWTYGYDGLDRLISANGPGHGAGPQLRL